VKTKTFVFVQPWQAAWTELDVADRPEPHDVLVKAEAAIINAGTEVAIYTGTHRNSKEPDAAWPRYPYIGGGTVAGVVLAAGEATSGILSGDKVVFSGRYTRYQTVGAARLLPVPEGVSFAEAAMARHSAISLNGVRLGAVALGETTVVLGLGLIGQYAAQYARLAGALTVIGVDPIEGRRLIASQCGANVTIGATGADTVSEVLAATDGLGADVSIEATGSPKVIPTALKCARDFGRVVLLGSPRGNVEIDPYNDIHRRGIRVIGSNNTSPLPPAPMPYWPWTPQKNEEAALGFIARGKLRLAPLISHRLEAEENLEIFDRLARSPSDYLGVVLQWS